MKRSDDTTTAKAIQRQFDDHWQGHSVVDLPMTKLEDARAFLQPLLDELQDNPHARVLDAGCGDGVHLAILDEALDPSIKITGLDLSHAALLTARRHAHSARRAVQADVGRLPFAAGTFDAVFSFGVLAYTPDPRRSLAELCRVARPGGLVGVWLYPRRRGLLGWAFAAVRAVCRLAGPFFTARVADTLVPLLPVLPTRSGVTLSNSTWRQCREVVLVNIAPPMLYFFDLAEVEQMLAEFGLEMVRSDADRPITLWTRKPNDHSREGQAA